MANSNQTITIDLIIKDEEKVLSLQDKIEELGGSLSTVGSAAEKVSGLFTSAMGDMDESTKIAVDSIATFSSVLSGLGEAVSIVGSVSNAVMSIVSLGPAFAIAGAAVVGFAALYAGLDAIAKGATAELNKSALELAVSQEQLSGVYDGMGEAAVNFYNGISSASGILNGFNSSIIMSAEAQRTLADEMNAVQTDITETIRTAVAERNGLSEEEILSVEEKFARMSELKQQELEVEQGYQDAAQTRAQALADSHTGSAEEYEAYAQRIIKSAQDTKDQVIAKADEQYTEELMLKQQMMEVGGEYNQAWYDQEAAALEAEYQATVNNANKKCGDTIGILQEGYLKQDESLQAHLETAGDLNSQMEDAEAEHSIMLAGIEFERERQRSLADGMYESKHAEFNRQVQEENDKHNANMEELNKKMTDNMDEKTQKQAGAWLTMVADSELYGGKISDETKKLADGFMGGFDKLPEDMKIKTQEIMDPMFSAMQSAQPGLYKEAENIANGILNRLKRSFDINSPSRKTRSIFNNVMKGAEVGLDDEKDSLFKRVNVIGKGVLTQFDMTKPGGLSSIYQRMQQSIGCEVGRLSAAIGINTNGALLASASTSGYNNAAGIPSSGNIKTVLNIDGREFAVATSGYMSEELAWRNT